MCADRIVFGPGPEPRPDLVRLARACLDHGGTLDDAARAVLATSYSPIEAIKALRLAEPALSLAEAKPLVYRNASDETQQAANQLWDSLEQFAEEIRIEDDGSASP